MSGNKEFIIKIFILLFLIILVFITSFRSGEKIYFLKNIIVNSNSAECNVARWNFNAKIINENKEDFDDQY